jgi:hypothetical protein
MAIPKIMTNCISEINRKMGSGTENPAPLQNQLNLHK